MAQRLSKRARNRDRWHARIEDWKQSNITQQTYCREHHLGLSTFRRWNRIFQKESTEARHDGGAPGFLPIKLVNDLVSSPGLTLVLKDEVRIEIANGFDGETLTRLLAVLKQAA